MPDFSHQSVSSSSQKTPLFLSIAHPHLLFFFPLYYKKKTSLKVIHQSFKAADVIRIDDVRRGCITNRLER